MPENTKYDFCHLLNKSQIALIDFWLLYLVNHRQKKPKEQKSVIIGENPIDSWSKLSRKTTLWVSLQFFFALYDLSDSSFDMSLYKGLLKISAYDITIIYHMPTFIFVAMIF